MNITRFFPTRSRILSLCVLAILCGALASPIQAGTVIFVNKRAIGQNNGASWANAYTELQPALTRAVDGDQIWVAAGTYYPTNPTAPNPDRNASFHWKQGVSIYGGFSGSEQNLSERNISGNPVIFSGDLGVQGDFSDNTLNLFVLDSGPAFNLSTILDGVTITGVNGTAIDYRTGTLNLNNCTIKDNRSGNLGTIELENSILNSSFSTFENNYSNGGGGAIYIRESASTSIKNCIFRNNRTNQSGGAIYTYLSQNLILVNSLFSGNISQGSGGAVFAATLGDQKIISCTFKGNAADNSSGKGGAYYVDAQEGTSALFQDDIFWDNSASGGTDAYGSSITTNVMKFGNNIIRGLSAPYVQTSQFPFVDLGGNVFSDPLFVSGTDLHLSPGSPAIDVGIRVSDWDALYPRIGTTPVDLGGGGRFLGPIQAIDIGAYEFQGVNHYLITTQSTGCGTVSPSGSVPVPEFTNKTIAFQPDPGCRVYSVIVDGVSHEEDLSKGGHTFSNVTAPHSLSVSFVSKYTIPFSEDWERGNTGWIASFAAGDGVQNVGDQNNALCLKDPSSHSTMNLFPGLANTFSIRFRASQGPGPSSIVKLNYEQGVTPITIELIPAAIRINGVVVYSYTYDKWHEIRGVIDIASRQIQWFLDNGTNPFYTSTNISTNKFNGISFVGNRLDACWDDVYLGNENTLTVNTPINGTIAVNAGWLRQVPSQPNKYVYRQISSTSYPSATLQANPADGYVLQTWTGDAASFGNSQFVSLPMNGPKTVSALFQDSPVRTVQRKWGTVDLPPISVKDGVLFDAMQGIPSGISPPLANFSNWVVLPGPNFKGTFIPSDQNHKGKV